MPKGSGRRPLPTAVKKLRGNPGKRALNDAEPVAPPGEPEMPPGLSDVARREWKAVVPELIARGTLSKIDGKALAAYCMCYAESMEAKKETQRLGMMIEEPAIPGRLRTGMRFSTRKEVALFRHVSVLMPAGILVLWLVR